MQQVLFETFINQWSKLFLKHQWLEAFSLSVLFHVILISFIWFCCQLYVMFVPHKPTQKIIEIEFIHDTP